MEYSSYYWTKCLNPAEALIEFRVKLIQSSVGSIYNLLNRNKHISTKTITVSSSPDSELKRQYTMKLTFSTNRTLSRLFVYDMREDEIREIGGEESLYSVITVDFEENIDWYDRYHMWIAKSYLLCDELLEDLVECIQQFASFTAKLSRGLE